MMLSLCYATYVCLFFGTLFRSYMKLSAHERQQDMRRHIHIKLSKACLLVLTFLKNDIGFDVANTVHLLLREKKESLNEITVWFVHGTSS